MGNIFNQDFRDFIKELNESNVKYILIGGYSIILHGHSRNTGDMDIWVDRTVEEGLFIRTIHRSDLLNAKKASGRYKDLDDLDNLMR